MKKAELKTKINDIVFRILLDTTIAALVMTVLTILGSFIVRSIEKGTTLEGVFSIVGGVSLVVFVIGFLFLLPIGIIKLATRSVPESKKPSNSYIGKRIEGVFSLIILIIISIILLYLFIRLIHFFWVTDMASMIKNF